MVTHISKSDRYAIDIEEFSELERFERFHHHQGNEFPVRSHVSRTRATMRSRSRAPSRRHAPFNGSNRRGRGKLWTIAN